MTYEEYCAQLPLGETVPTRAEFDAAWPFPQGRGLFWHPEGVRKAPASPLAPRVGMCGEVGSLKG